MNVSPAMDNLCFLISDHGKAILNEPYKLDIGEDKDHPEFIEDIRLLRHPREPVLHLFHGRKLVSSIHLTPARFWQQRRRGFTADVETDTFRITVRLCELDHRVYGLMLLVSRLPPLKDISDVLARAGIVTIPD